MAVFWPPQVARREALPDASEEGGRMLGPPSIPAVRRKTWQGVAEIGVPAADVNALARHLAQRGLLDWVAARCTSRADPYTPHRSP